MIGSLFSNPVFPLLFILPINTKTENINSARVKKIPFPSPIKENNPTNGMLLQEINSTSQCHLLEEPSSCSFLWFCFVSVVCASVVRTQKKRRMAGRKGHVEVERKKQGPRANLSCLSLKNIDIGTKTMTRVRGEGWRIAQSLLCGFSSCPFYLLGANPGHRAVLGRGEAPPNRPHQSRGKLTCHFLTWNRISPPCCVLRPLPPSPSCLLLPNELTCMMNISAHGLSNRQHH